MEEIRQNVKAVQERLRRASEKWGRVPDLIAVSKTVEPARVNLLCGTGITQLGENRVQEILEKFPFLDASLQFIKLDSCKRTKLNI